MPCMSRKIVRFIHEAGVQDSTTLKAHIKGDSNPVPEQKVFFDILKEGFFNITIHYSLISNIKKFWYGIGDKIT